MTTQPTIGGRDLIAFMCELAMLVLLVGAGHGMVEGWRGWALGAFLAFVVVGIWSQWMAPTSARRLANPQRYFVQVMLFITTALYASAGGLTIWGIVFAVIAIAAFGSRLRTDP